MLKNISIVLMSAAVLLLGATGWIKPVEAGTCASNCGSAGIRFVPGQDVAVQIINRTSSLVLLERVQGTDPIPLQPGQELRFQGWGGTQPNVSIVFWDPTSLPLQAKISQPDRRILRIEIRPGFRPPGDRSVYILDDGRVNIL